MPRKKKDATVAAPTPETEQKVKEAPTASKPTKSRAKPEAKKAMAKEVVIQAAGEEWNLADLEENVLSAYVSEGHQRGRVSKLTLYVKPEERKVYYVINEKKTGSVDF